MKKLLAVLIAVLMAFSVAVVPASAADYVRKDTVVVAPGESEETTEGEFAGVVDSTTSIYDDLKAGEYENALDGVFELIDGLVNAIHSLIGKIMAVAGKECALCAELHGATDKVVADDLVVSDKVAVF